MPNETFGAPDDGFEYYLVIWNSGQHKASNLGISIMGCNGSGDHDFPPTADPGALSPGEALIPSRGFEIRLGSSGERYCWDIAECNVRWEDGLGPHLQRFHVERRNW